MQKTFFILLFFTTCVASWAQSGINGTVVFANDREPVVGATIVVKGTNTATVTDIDGKFTLIGIAAGQEIEVSYIGTQSQTLIGGENMEIALKEEDSLLEEVVITAFGEQKRSAFTGSAAVMSAGSIEKKQVTNVISALRGEAAGVQMTTSGSPSESPTIRIRGFSSINADNDPLIILDGSPFEGQWNDINPADVENVTILKDAASAALYGARGANGIIMITTKRAKTGDATVTLDAKWGASTRIKRDYETIDNIGQYYETYYKALYNYQTNIQGLNPVEASLKAYETLDGSSAAGGLGYITMSVPEGERLIGQNGRLNPNATVGALLTIEDSDDTYWLMPDDWLDEATRTGIRQEYNININGGNEKAQFYASIGYLNNEGITVGSDFERYSGRVKTNYQAKKWLRLGANTSFTRSNANYISSSGNNLFSVCQNIAPIYPLYIRDEDGVIKEGIGGKLYDYGDGATIGLTRAYQPSYNPIQEVTLNTYKGISNLYTLDLFTDINPIEALKITLKGNITDNNREGNYGYNPYYGWSSTMYTGGSVTQSKDETFSYNFQELVNYYNTFGSHNVELLVGHENFKRQYKFLSGTREGVASYLNNQTLSGAINVIEATSITGSSDGSNSTGYNTEGWFVRGLYDFKGKYYANFSVRADASSRFHPDHRWGAFYSLGGAWVMSEESWIKSISWLNTLKLKASYGQVGNDAIGDARYLDTYKIVNSDGKIGLQIATIGNPDITWETVGNFNAGIEFELIGNRISGGIEYFNRKTSDMLCFVRVPQSAGYAGSYQNIGDMVNKGVEMDFKFGIIRTKDFQWDINVNATLYNNKITKIADQLQSGSVDGHNGYASNDYYYGEGLPMYTMYLPKYAGVTENGESQWYTRDKNGDINGTTTSYTDACNEDNLFLCGDPTPDVYGGFGTSASYNGFDLNISFAYSIGGKAYDYGYAALMKNPTSGDTGYAIHKDMLNAWSTDNTDSNIPRWQYGDMNTSGMSDRFITDASWLTFSNVNLGYSLPTYLVRNMGLSRLRVYVSGENLYYWSARMGFDPRTSFDGAAETSSYSPSRIISGGITVSF